jgi:hypothetical protein
VGATAQRRRRRLARQHPSATRADRLVRTTGQNGSLRTASSIRSKNGCRNSASVSFG